MSESKHSPEPAQHNDGCAEWCNHCLLCGVGILYGERCHAHFISTSPASTPEEGTR